MSESRLVYSTANNNTCSRCHKPLKNCKCQTKTATKTASKNPVQAATNTPNDGVVRISRETKGRKGKGVTLVKGVKMTETELKQLSKQLKTLCGSGGSLKDGVIELQGDHREQVQTFLSQNLKQTIKLAGG